MRPIVWASLTVALATVGSVLAEADFENAPIHYSATQPDNCITHLQARLDRRAVMLTADREVGYLRAVLDALQVPAESQTLVFSKTSLQIRRISPTTPRAIYFNDDVYIGYCQGGDVLEVSAVDPQLGTVFYTFDQHPPAGKPKFQRQTEMCLVCHSSSRTGGVPGHLVRSLFVDETGHPVLAAGSKTVDHATPIEERWGGWYVTGKPGSSKHKGNLIVSDKLLPHDADTHFGETATSLADRFDHSNYLTGHSDIVALMVLEHQLLVHNRITNANFATRQALEYDSMMGQVMKLPAGKHLESTTRRIHHAGDKLVDAILLVNEARLTEPQRGTSGFAEVFTAQGPRDRQGRSLRDLDLSRRLFQHPCSYLIYSKSFQSLPDEVLDYVWQRLWEVLSGQDQSPKFAHLTPEDRANIIAIIRSTVTPLPVAWTRS